MKSSILNCFLLYSLRLPLLQNTTAFDTTKTRLAFQASLSAAFRTDHKRDTEVVGLVQSRVNPTTDNCVSVADICGEGNHSHRLQRRYSVAVSACETY